MPRAAANGAASKPKKTRAPKAHKLPDPLPEGTVVRDLQKKEWKIGKPIGSGGFGLIYLAGEASGTVGMNSEYVIKIEPHSNGPLFCELAFYQRVAKPDMIQKWKASKKLKRLGMPKFIATGSHELKGVRYRFMVMERFGEDLQKRFEADGKTFPRKSVLQMGLRIIDVLEYIHDHEYAHADIKASNLLLGYSKGNADQVYLVDFGLAYKYTSDGVHRDYKEDPRKCHDGTVEFTSRDAHKGVSPSRRGDLEILGYCLLQWLCSKLPWENNLNNKDYVRDEKVKYMNNIPSLMKTCFPQGDTPDEISSFLAAVAKLEYTERPDYNKLRNLLLASLKKLGHKDDGKVTFSPSKATKRAPSSAGGDGTPAKKMALSPVKAAAANKKPVAAKKAAAAKTKTTTKKRVASPSPSPTKRAPAAGKGRATARKRAASDSPSPTKPKAKKTTAKKKAKVSQSTTSTQTTPGLKERRSARSPRS